MEKTEILKRPLINEKVTTILDKIKEKEKEGEGKERYVFLVNQKANKIQISKAIEDMYGVKVASVNTMNYKGKPKTRNTKSKITSGRSKSYKKAIITLHVGEYIDLYEFV
jgi:large subunit ribosomal protein L23